MEWTVLQVKHWLSDLSRIMQEKKEELSRYDQADWRRGSRCEYGTRL